MVLHTQGHCVTKTSTSAPPHRARTAERARMPSTATRAHAWLVIQVRPETKYMMSSFTKVHYAVIGISLTHADAWLQKYL